MKMKLIATLVLVCGLLLLAVAYAAEAPILYVSPDGEYSVSAINVMKIGDDYYLFLPGNMNLAEMKIGFKGAEKVEINGKPLTGNEHANELNEKNTLQFDDRKKIEFTVLTGSENLPVLYILTESGNLDKIHENKENKEAGYLYMVNGDGNVEYDGTLEHMKMRGHASVSYGKKNYQIKLDKGTDLLGFGKTKKWVLTGNWLDKSFIRNQMTFDLAEYMGMPYTPERQQAEVYVNHEYLGLYLFMEKVEIQENRVAITDLEKATEELNEEKPENYPKATGTYKNGGKYRAYQIPNNPEDITGGYLLEYEFEKGRYEKEPSGYTTGKNLHIVIKSPEFASMEQAAYVAEFMQGFENAIWADDGYDKETGKHYSEFVDMDSLVRKYMVNEFSQNYDGNASSEYFFKPIDSESKVAYAGPIWDLDNSYANYARDDNKNTIMSFKTLYIGKASKNIYWWPNIYKHEDFQEAIRKEYGKLKKAAQIILGQEKGTGKLTSLEEYEKAIEKSVEMNYVRYPNLKQNRGNAATGKNLSENIQYIRNFIEIRLPYLEKAWGISEAE